MTCKRHLLRPEAFSLIEVTIALGIVSFAVLSMLGLNATSITAIRDSRMESVGQRITKDLVSELSSSDFSARPTAMLTKYFDVSGFRVTDAASAIYVATVNPVASPTIGGASVPAESAAVFSVKVYRSPGAAIPLSSTNQGFSMPLVLANRQKG